MSELNNGHFNGFLLFQFAALRLMANPVRLPDNATRTGKATFFQLIGNLGPDSRMPRPSVDQFQKMLFQYACWPR
jgi:hypothetical protein